ncbi:MAG: ATPase domain-containing protein [Archaeoglobaceae archaeon]
MRLNTGIPGMDEILNDGIPERNVVLLSGGPGVEHGVEEIIRFDLDEIDGELKRSVIVWKMRGTSHSMKRHVFEITSRGIIVYPDKILKLR